MEYSQEFWEELERFIDRTPHICNQCRVADGGHRWMGDRYAKTTSTVRLALIDPKGPPNDARNVHFYCTTCRKPLDRKKMKSLKPSELPQLFKKTLLEEIQERAREKVKKFVPLDENGDPIPF